MDHVQILVLVACFVLLNLAQIADETLLMVCLFLRHQFLRNQAPLLMDEHVVEKDRHSLPLTLNSSCRDSSLRVHIQFQRFARNAILASDGQLNSVQLSGRSIVIAFLTNY